MYQQQEGGEECGPKFSWEHARENPPLPPSPDPGVTAHRREIESICLSEARAAQSAARGELKIAHFENEEIQAGSGRRYSGFRVLKSTPATSGSSPSKQIATCVYLPLSQGELPEIPYILSHAQGGDLAARIRAKIEAWSRERLGLGAGDLLSEAQRSSKKSIAPQPPAKTQHGTSAPLRNAGRPSLARSDDFSLLETVLIVDAVSDIGLAALTLPPLISPDVVPDLAEQASPALEEAGEVLSNGADIAESAGGLADGAGDLLSGFGEAAGDLLGGLGDIF